MIDEIPSKSEQRLSWRRLSPWLKTILAVGVICALFFFNRIELQIFTPLSETWWWLVFAFVFMLPPYLIVSYRFWLVLRNQGIDADFGLAIKWTMIGSFFDVMMPSNSGGDVVKAGYIANHVGAGKRTVAVISVVFDRVLGLLGLFLLAGIASVVGWGVIKSIPGIYGLLTFLVLFCFGTLLLFRILGSRRFYGNKRLQSILEKYPLGSRLYGIISCFNSLREKPKELISVLGLSILNHCFWCAALFCITVAFNQSVTLIQGFAVFPIAIFSNTFGFAGGFGVGTAGFDLIFSKLLNVHVGAAIGLTFQTLSVISRLLGLPFYLRNH